MKTNIYIQKSKNYEIFKTLQGNRELNISHKEKLKKSFKQNYLISPIIINEKYEIIDGQHRFNAARDLGYPVYYILINGYSLEEVKMLNTNSKNWKREDYLNAYCDLGFEEYIKFKKFYNDIKEFTIGSAERIAAGHQSDNMSDFRNGKFKFADVLDAYDTAQKILMFKPYYKGFNRNTFVGAVMRLIKNENYNHSQMIHKLSLNPSVLVDCANTSQYVLLLEDVYNYKSRNKTNLRY
tara:strand:+ start:202 stop:915 length:714 start_codon:yes stop_codon:yes gene_type:complete